MVINFKDGDNEPLVISSYKTVPTNGSILSRNDEVIQIEYQNNEGTYLLEIPIKVKYPVGLSVIQHPKHTYSVKDTIDLSNLKVGLSYNDGSIGEILQEGITTSISNGEIITDKINSVKISYTYIDYELSLSYKLNIVKDNKNVYFDNQIKTFYNASKEDISYMVNLHKNNQIDIKDYWKIGDYKVHDIVHVVGKELHRNLEKSIIIVDFDKIVDGRKAVVVFSYIVDYEYYKYFKIYDILSNTPQSQYINSIFSDTSSIKTLLPIYNFTNNRSDLYMSGAIGNNKYKTFISLLVGRPYDSGFYYSVIGADQFEDSIDVVELSFKINSQLGDIKNISISLKNNEILKSKNKIYTYIHAKPEDVFGDNAFEYFKTASNRSILKNKDDRIFLNKINVVNGDMNIVTGDFIFNSITSSVIGAKNIKRGTADIRQYYIDGEGSLKTESIFEMQYYKKPNLQTNEGTPYYYDSIENATNFNNKFMLISAKY